MSKKIAIPKELEKATETLVNAIADALGHAANAGVPSVIAIGVLHLAVRIVTDSTLEGK